MILAVGEILFDVYPGHQYLGGAPFNFVFHLKQFGVPVHFVSRVGNDVDGEKIFKTLQEHQFNTEYLQIDRHKSTGKVLTELDKDKVPRFNILKDVAYDYIEFDPSLVKLLSNDIQLIYIGTLAQRTPNGFATIQKILSNKDPKTKCLFDVNLRPNCYRKEIVTESLKQTNILKLNLDELNYIGEIMDGEYESHDLIYQILERYHIEVIAVTRGENGSEITTDADRHEIKKTVAKKVVDTVGAGDAYAAMLALGYLKKWPMRKTLSLAHHFATRICTIDGALPKTNEIYQEINQLVEA